MTFGNSLYEKSSARFNVLEKIRQYLHTKKIRQVITDIEQHPETGIAKPEQLKHSLSGFWSRRITEEHRIIYEITKDKIIVLSLKGHYLLIN